MTHLPGAYVCDRCNMGFAWDSYSQDFLDRVVSEGHPYVNLYYIPVVPDCAGTFRYRSFCDRLPADFIEMEDSARSNIMANVTDKYVPTMTDGQTETATAMVHSAMALRGLTAPDQELLITFIAAFGVDGAGVKHTRDDGRPWDSASWKAYVESVFRTEASHER